MKEFVEKPWGAEEWIIHGENAPYAIKHLYVNPQQELSLQYHNEKHETMIILEGMGEFIFGPPSMAEKFKGVSFRTFTVGDILIIPPKTIHKIRAFTAVKILEVSTPHLSDLVRVEDKYGRE